MPATDRPGLAEALAGGSLVLDAAMGTRLVARGLDLTVDDPALWAVDRPDEVARLHRLDVEAGSDALVTDTFGANAAWLARFGRAAEAAAINHQAAGLARLAAGLGRLVFGSIGPTASDDPGALRGQAEALVSGRDPVDALLLETFRLDRAEAALRLLRDVGVPVVASLYAWPAEVGEAARRLVDAGAAAVGANCVVGMAASLALVRAIRQAGDAPIWLKPSAGLPGGAMEPPRAFEEAAGELVDLGVGLVGGCCGTTEAHVAALRRGLDRCRAG